MDIPVDSRKAPGLRIALQKLPEPHKHSFASIVNMGQIDLKNLVRSVEFGENFGSSHSKSDRATE